MRVGLGVCWAAWACGVVGALLPLAARLGGHARGWILIGGPMLFALVGMFAIHTSRRIGKLFLFPMLLGAGQVALLGWIWTHFERSPFRYQLEAGFWLGLVAGLGLFVGGWILAESRNRD